MCGTRAPPLRTFATGTRRGTREVHHVERRREFCHDHRRHVPAPAPGEWVHRRWGRDPLLGAAHLRSARLPCGLRGFSYEISGIRIPGRPPGSRPRPGPVGRGDPPGARTSRGRGARLTDPGGGHPLPQVPEWSGAPLDPRRSVPTNLTLIALGSPPLDHIGPDVWAGVDRPRGLAPHGLGPAPRPRLPRLSSDLGVNLPHIVATRKSPKNGATSPRHARGQYL